MGIGIDAPSAAWFAFVAYTCQFPQMVREYLKRQIIFLTFMDAHSPSYICGVVRGSVRIQCVYVCADLAAVAIGVAVEDLILVECHRPQCQMVKMPSRCKFSVLVIICLLFRLCEMWRIQRVKLRVHLANKATEGLDCLNVIYQERIRLRMWWKAKKMRKRHVKKRNAHPPQLMRGGC
jgi:hypothetical protein